MKKYADKEHVEKIYIGIASGKDDDSAMKRRYDKTKKEENINEVIAIYEASDQQECREMEKALVRHFKGNKKMHNENDGGGGRNSQQPKFYVYLALRITPAGH